MALGLQPLKGLGHFDFFGGHFMTNYLTADRVMELTAAEETGCDGREAIGPLECNNDELRSRAIEILATHPNFRVLLMRHAIVVESANGKVLVSGYVPSYYHKQMLQETLRRVAGVVHIDNRVLVVYPTRLSDR